MRKTLFFIFILALFLRVLSVVTQDESRREPKSDAKEYDTIAVNIASGKGLSQTVNGVVTPTTRRTPGYPVFLAAIYKVFGHSYPAVKFAQALMGALFCLVIFFIGKAVYNDLTGAIAAFITAVYKPFALGFFYYGGPSYLLSEYLYMFLTGLSLLFFILFIKRGRNADGILAGIFTGAAVLTRPEFIIFPVMAFFYIWVSLGFSVSKSVKKYFLAYLFIGMTLTPWVARNYMAQGKFIPLSTYSGHMFWMGNNSLVRGGWSFPADYSKVVEGIKGLSEYEKNKVFFRKGAEWLAENKNKVPALLVRKELVHWAPFEEGFSVFNPYYAFILLLGAIGILFFRKKGLAENMIISVLLTSSLAAVIIFGDPRYRYPYEFCLILFSSLTVVRLCGFALKKELV